MADVEIVTSASAGGPPRQSLEKFPPRRMVRCADADSRSISASCSGFSGRSMLGGAYQQFDLFGRQRAMLADLQAGDGDRADLCSNQFKHLCVERFHHASHLTVASFRDGDFEKRVLGGI